MDKQYDTEFNAQAVRLATEINKSVAQVVQKLDVPASALHGWDPGNPGPTGWAVVWSDKMWEKDLS